MLSSETLTWKIKFSSFNFSKSLECYQIIEFNNFKIFFSSVVAIDYCCL